VVLQALVASQLRLVAGLHDRCPDVVDVQVVAADDHPVGAGLDLHGLHPLRLDDLSGDGARAVAARDPGTRNRSSVIAPPSDARIADSFDAPMGHGADDGLTGS
jgi:hypothetical protein